MPNKPLEKASSPHTLSIALVNTGRVVNAKGGTEKVFCDMANAFVQRGHQVAAVYLDHNQGLPGFQLDNRVRVCNTYSNKLPFSLSKRGINLRAFALSKRQRHIKRHIFSAQAIGQKLQPAIMEAAPDVIVSFQIETTYAIQAVVGKSIPIVTMLHGHPSTYFTPKLFEGIKTAAAASDVVQVLRPEFVELTRSILPSATIEVIPNSVPQCSLSADLDSHKIINVGRFHPEKNQHLLIEAFALIKDRFSDWTLELWGETNLDPSYTGRIQNLIKHHHLEDRVLLCGTTNDVLHQLKKASIFAFPSAFEGWGLALTEAMSIGLPSVGLKTCPAVNTLIRDGENGLLCDATPEGLAEALSKLMNDESLRIRQGSTAKESVKDFSPEQVWNYWEQLLRRLTNEKRPLDNKN